MTGQTIRAGAAQVDITPPGSHFLYGYPHVERSSTGVHDPLLASSLWVSDGANEVVFIACDVIYVGKELTQRARLRIAESTGIPPENVMVTATHTHSGPVTVSVLSNQADPVVPKPDSGVLTILENGIVASAEQAYASARPCSLGLAIADGSCVGTNRRDPSGPSIPELPVLAVRDRDGDRILAVMLICSMHPTVLHEDSLLISADFPGAARAFLQDEVIGKDCPVIYHTGACGNQSPRHVVSENTFEEVERLGRQLGKSIAESLARIEYVGHAPILTIHGETAMPIREFPAASDAEQKLTAARKRLQDLRDANAPRAEVRTAECDLFGAEETLTLAQTAEAGQVREYTDARLPAEVQIFQIGKWTFVGWPGETFVEIALEVRSRFPDAYIISMANSDLQGYLVTQEAVEENAYEASNALFRSPESGEMLVAETIRLLSQLP